MKYQLLKFTLFKCFLLLLTLSCCLYVANGQIKLSDQAQIAVVTIGPYQNEIWSAFGHNGFRVYDPQNNIDWFYNYGLFDFEQKEFFLNFALGILKYKVGVGSYPRVIKYYKNQNRWMKEQYLNLTIEEKQSLFDFLQNNVLPQHSEYRYNYVYNNCATKIRDVLVNLFHRRLIFDSSYYTENKTIRALMYDYLEYQPWGKLGMSIVLGQQVDKHATIDEYMFLPDYIFLGLENSMIIHNDSVTPLVSKSQVAYSSKEEKHTHGFWTPLNTSLIVFFIIGFFTNRDIKKSIRTKWIDNFLFFVVGFVGFWVLFLWLGTEHLSKNNLNILWAIPLHFPVLFFLKVDKYKKYAKHYFKWFGWWYIALLLTWAILPQPLNIALVPIILSIALRCFYISYRVKETSKKELINSG